MPNPQTYASGAEEWLTSREVAQLTKLAPQTLSNLRWRGEGPAFTKLSPGRGGRIRYRRRDVEQWLAGETATAA
ncbi:helix-turn-helix domain-containing protein [Kitasatospora sp. NBC_00085]|uniref:helix-turn-helix transcriptional regulator n=1 Tax=Kitasatospora sp. NBC_00085 TaxID=2903566 RepID=UPI003248124B